MSTRPEWTQTTLIPPSAVEATIRLGVVGSADHAQMQYEIVNATDGTLLAMGSVPHLRIEHVPAQLPQMVLAVLDELAAFVVPF